MYQDTLAKIRAKRSTLLIELSAQPSSASALMLPDTATTERLQSLTKQLEATCINEMHARNVLRYNAYKTFKKLQMAKAIVCAYPYLMDYPALLASALELAGMKVLAVPPTDAADAAA